MDIQLQEDADNGHWSDGFGSRNSTGRLRFRLSQPCDDTRQRATESLPSWELLQRIRDLTARVESLEDRLPSPPRAGPAFDADIEPELTHDEFDDPDEADDAEPSLTGQEYGGLRLDDLPRGPLSIDVVATALGKTARTIRGWCQIEKYDIPAHKEAGRWRFYRDELVAWYGDYEAVSRRDAKRAQARRRKTKHGMTARRGRSGFTSRSSGRGVPTTGTCAGGNRRGTGVRRSRGSWRDPRAKACSRLP